MDNIMLLVQELETNIISFFSLHADKKNNTHPNVKLIENTESFIKK